MLGIELCPFEKMGLRFFSLLMLLLVLLLGRVRLGAVDCLSAVLFGLLGSVNELFLLAVCCNWLRKYLWEIGI